MKELLILSGKGGTGKTSLSASFAALSENGVFCDADVEAPNLAILLEPKNSVAEDFFGMPVARIDPRKCARCGLCEKSCRFLAIQDFRVLPESCEGCGVCSFVCPGAAISLHARKTGTILRSITRQGSLVHGEILPGMGNSGKLVSRIKAYAREEARRLGADLLLIDGPPGIGCPVISALGGVSYVVAVTEPNPSGVHDLERLLRLVEHFRIPAGVVVNKADLEPAVSRRIRKRILICGFDDLGELPFDPAVPEGLARGRIPVEGDSPFATEARKIWDKIIRPSAEPERSAQHEGTV